MIDRAAREPRPAGNPFGSQPNTDFAESGEAYAGLLEEFQAAIDRRVQREERLAEVLARGEDDQERQVRQELERLRQEREAQLARLDEEFERQRSAAVADADANESRARNEHLDRVREIEGTFHRELAELEARYQDSSWVASSILDDTAEESPRRQYERSKQTRERLRDQQVAELAAVESAYRAAVEARGWHERRPVEFDAAPRSIDEAQQGFADQITAARQGLDALAELKLPWLFVGYRWLAALLVMMLVVAVPVYLLVDPASVGASVTPAIWAGLAAGTGALVSLLLLTVIYTLSSMQQSDVLQQVQHSLAAANWLHQRWLALAEREQQRSDAEFQRLQAEFEAQRMAALERFQRAHEERRSELERVRNQQLQAENSRFGRQQVLLGQQRTETLADLEQDHLRRRSTLVSEFEATEQQLIQALEELTHRRRRRQTELWHELKSDWDAAARAFEAGLREAQADARRRFAPWEELAHGAWEPPLNIPSAFFLGEYKIDLERWQEAIPADMRLAPRSTHLVVPSVVRFPGSASLLLRASSAAGREAAQRLLQSLMLRWLTLMPPGKLRFTIIDPVGLGESFAGFMHLADFDEQLVTKRIWTEPDHIEQQLADLTEHMENVLQMYLRNEFASLEEYNVFAGEVAEPYRVLVITDFPAKFSELAARRLTSILTSGPRCGVFTLMSMDPRRELPHGFDPRVLDERMPTLTWKQLDEQPDELDDMPDGNWHEAPRPGAARRPAEHAFAPATGPLARWPLKIDEPPPPEQFTAIVRRVGEASRDARRVEVAFERVAPGPDRLWSHSSLTGIDVPLGRAGATKLQHMRLGKGTSQHMLVAGKTGSGKSTFLHCLITNVALHYSPDEVRFFLVDFKKGVEFKDYAAFTMPHAEVIAIESDREFGVSVLQRLDGVLQERGELFRKLGVQDLAGGRQARPDVRLPRILLVIDEFQEFFVEEDRLSQTAALLLDRLIRQGRAFGIHVILGSQTLGGAYSLARSTMGQVAVRVALQCSEADAHLILSEENTAARLLTRPGEAIYNDANGLVEGNHPFQIAWLPDHERETWLRRLRDLAAARGLSVPPPIVFEGNIPSSPEQNPELVALLSRGVALDDSSGQRPPRIWLGEAVEIKPPTGLLFERRNGANLLIVGQDADAALGIMSTAAITLAAYGAEVPAESTGGGASRETGEGSESAVRTATVMILDGSLPESPEAAIWSRVSAHCPESVRRVRPREAAEAVRELSTELKRRMAHPDERHPPKFVLVFHLGRFRDLKKGDEDFGFSAFGGGEEQPADPSRLFADLLANGPAFAIHTIVWCDSANTVERWFSRQSLRELENRVAFQMNAGDSSNLIDSPAASRLGPHRALLYREETGTAEKFRPYRPPEEEWLRSLRSNPPPAAQPEDARQPPEPDGKSLEVATDLSEFRIL